MDWRRSIKINYRRVYQFYIVVVSILVTALAACGDNNNPDTSGQQENNPTKAVDTVYAQSVEPVFYRSCNGCHRNGGIAPFSLIREEGGYETAMQRAAQIKFQLNQQSMPPFLANNDGSCKSFQHENSVSTDEISAINAWVDSLTPDTVADNFLAAPQDRQLPAITQPDVVLDMNENYSVSQSVSDEYRCYIVDAGLDSDKLVTGFEVVPGNPGIVHHVVLFNTLAPATDIPLANYFDKLDTKLGYQCFGDANLSKNVVVAAWAPGTGATFFPQNTGIRIPSNNPLIMQVHYNTDNARGNYSDRTKIKLQLVDPNLAGVKEAIMAYHYVSNFTLTNSNTKVTETISLNELLGPYNQFFPNGLPVLNLLGVFPHMHRYGQKLVASRTDAAGNNECLVDVPRWDFDWQRMYFYDSQAAGIELNSSDNFAIDCEYDLSSLPAGMTQVKEGSNSGSEMCVNFYYLTLAQ